MFEHNLAQGLLKKRPSSVQVHPDLVSFRPMAYILIGMKRSSFIDLLNWPTIGISFPRYLHWFCSFICQPMMSKLRILLCIGMRIDAAGQLKADSSRRCLVSEAGEGRHAS
jgi:hypothetical protein